MTTGASNNPGALLFPVDAAVAFAWVQGNGTTVDLINSIDPAGGALVLSSLESRSCWRSGVIQARYWHGRGCQFAVSVSENPLMLAHYRRLGCRFVFREPFTDVDRWRVLLAPAEFRAAIFGRRAGTNPPALAITG